MTEAARQHAEPVILIVEDENIVAMDIERALTRLGYRVAGIANNADHAVELGCSLRPDLVLMDIQLKGAAQGTEAAARIRERVDIPIIFLTAYADDKTLARAKAAEPYGYILKPFEETELKTAIEVALHKHREQQLRERKSQQALRQSEESFRALVESVKDYTIIMLDLAGTVLTWNRGAEAIEGYRASEIVGRHFSVLLTEDDQKRGHPESLIAAALREGRYEEEGWRVRKGGERFWAHVTFTLVRGADGSPVGFVRILRDLTEHKNVEDQLRLAVRMRDDFLSIASHELRTPITSLKLQLQMLQRETKLDQGVLPPFAKFANAMDVWARQTKRLEELIDQLLDVSRIRSGNLTLSRVEIDVGELTREVVRRHADQLRESACPVELKTDSSVRLSCDRSRIEQVITNLLTNACKYGPAKPIRIAVTRRGEYTRLTVQDGGRGIPKNKQAAIFERFERAAKDVPGLGLGLYITREIVKAHGGSIAVESEPGAGATFIVDLPAQLGASRDQEQLKEGNRA